MTAADPPTPARARNLLFAASRLGAFGLACGLELSPAVLLHPSVIERCCRHPLVATSAGTRRSVRTNLRHLAAATAVGPAPARLPRERAKPPYGPDEIAAYLALADAQPTLARRRRGIALVCLGAGAGLIGTDLRRLRGCDVIAVDGGTVVEVAGPNARRVPVRAEFEQRLCTVARHAGDAPLIGTGHARRKNVTSPLVAALASGTTLAPLEVSRLRSTWLARCADDLGLRAFLDAAGVRCTQRLGDLVAQLAPVDEARAITLLRGRC